MAEEDGLSEAARLRVRLQNLKARVDDQIALEGVPATLADLEAAKAEAASALIEDAAKVARLALAKDAAKKRRR